MPKKARRNKMPGQDKTGPRGQGSMTGRGLGPCGVGTQKGLVRGRGQGLGRGFGRGMGWRCCGMLPYAEPVNLTKAEEKKILEAELKEIEIERQEIEKRLKELK